MICFRCSSIVVLCRCPIVIVDLLLDNYFINQINDVWEFNQGGTKYYTIIVYIKITSNLPIAPAPYIWIWKSFCWSKNKKLLLVIYSGNIKYKKPMTRKTSMWMMIYVYFVMKIIQRTCYTD